MNKLIDEIDKHIAQMPEHVEARKTAQLLKEAGMTLREILKGMEQGDEAEATCAWTEDDFNHFWNTECGEAFVMVTEEPPSAHKMRYCPYCGKRIEERRPVPDRTSSIT